MSADELEQGVAYHDGNMSADELDYQDTKQK